MLTLWFTKIESNMRTLQITALNTSARTHIWCFTSSWSHLSEWKLAYTFTLSIGFIQTTWCISEQIKLSHVCRLWKLSGWVLVQIRQASLWLVCRSTCAHSLELLLIAWWTVEVLFCQVWDWGLLRVFTDITGALLFMWTFICWQLHRLCFHCQCLVCLPRRGFRYHMKWTYCIRVLLLCLSIPGVPYRLVWNGLIAD